jgi:hypothetical protein
MELWLVRACGNWGLFVENSKRKWDGFEGKTMVGMSTIVEETPQTLQPC